MSQQYANSLLPNVTSPVARNFASNFVSARGIEQTANLSSTAPFNSIRSQFMGFNGTSGGIKVQMPQNNYNLPSSTTSSFNTSIDMGVGAGRSQPSTSGLNQLSISTPGASQAPVVSNVRSQVAQSNQFSSATPGLDTAEEAVEGVSKVASTASMADPLVALAQVGQQLGSGLNDIFTTATNYNINQGYMHTMTTGHGIGLVQEATNVAASKYGNSSVESLGGKIGSIFGGPLGALAGRGIASLFETPTQHAVAYSPTGEFNPQSGTTPQSQSSWMASPSIDPGQSMDSMDAFQGPMDTDQITNAGSFDSN